MTLPDPAPAAVPPAAGAPPEAGSPVFEARQSSWRFRYLWFPVLTLANFCLQFGSPDRDWTHWMALFGSPALAVGWLALIVWQQRRESSVQLDPAGITVGRRPLVPWNLLSGVSVLELPLSKPTVRFHAHDPEAVAELLRHGRARWSRWPRARRDAAVLLVDGVRLPVPVEELLDQVRRIGGLSVDPAAQAVARRWRWLFPLVIAAAVLVAFALAGFLAGAAGGNG